MPLTHVKWTLGGSHRHHLILQHFYPQRGLVPRTRPPTPKQASLFLYPVSRSLVTHLCSCSRGSVAPGGVQTPSSETAAPRSLGILSLPEP